MLRKLLKYEIPALGRKLLPLYAAWAATAAFLGIAIGRVESKSEFVMVLSGMLYTGVATAVFVMGVYTMVQRYNQSLLGDEGYFTHVLPVSTSMHIANKTISTIIWVLLSFVALFVTGIVIVVFSGELLKIDWSMIEFDLSWLRFTDLLIFLELLAAAVLSIAKTVLAIYAALTIGHQARNHVGLASFGAYLGVLTLESIIGNFASKIFSFNELSIERRGEFALFIALGMLVMVVMSGIYFYICNDLLKRRLNLA